MDFMKHFEIVWEVVKKHFVALLLSTIVLFVVSIVSLGFMAPVAMAGYMQSLLFAIREDRKPEVRDLFSELRLFLPLLGFSFLTGMAIFIGLKMLVLPGLIVILAVAFFCLYLVPLMTDQEMNLVDALQESARMATLQPIGEHLMALAVYLILISVGSSTGLGAILTTPLAVLFVLSVYEDRLERLFPQTESNTEQAEKESSPPPPPPPPGGDVPPNDVE